MRRAAAMALALLVAALPARAERLLLTLSADTITIASNFQGADVTVFGTALDDLGALARLDGADLVLTARGPSGTITVREKDRAGGLWLNRTSRAFANAPFYLGVLSTQPVWRLLDPGRRLGDEVGLNAIAAARLKGGRTPPSAEDESFVAALRRIQERRRLWSEDFEGVELIGGALFKGRFELPPKVPLGRFEIEAQLVRDGETVARETVGFEVVKAGFEAQAAAVAETHRLAYGIAVVALALLFGWLASVIFRRD